MSLHPRDAAMKRTACLVRYDLQCNGRNVGKPSYGYAHLSERNGELRLTPSKWVRVDGYIGTVTGAIATIVAPDDLEGMLAPVGLYRPLVVCKNDFVQIIPTSCPIT